MVIFMQSFKPGMGLRESIASELLDTIRFGSLDKINGAGTYYKRRFEDKDAYVVPFGQNKYFYGAVVIYSAGKINIRYKLNNEAQNVNVRNLSEAKEYIVKRFIQSGL
jgi:hypothetical protein